MISQHISFENRNENLITLSPSSRYLSLSLIFESKASKFWRNSREEKEILAIGVDIGKLFYLLLRLSFEI